MKIRIFNFSFLPPSFDGLLTTLLFGKSTLDTKVSAALLLNEKRKAPCLDDCAEGLIVKTKAFSGHGRYRDGGSERGKSRSKSKTSRDVVCYWLHKRGYLKRDCKLFKKVPKKRKCKERSLDMKIQILRVLLDLMEMQVTRNLSGDDSHNDVKVLLSEHSMEPESESQLKNLLPAVVSTFNLHKPVSDLIVELKKHQLSSETGVAEWAKDALLGLDKGAPFSLCLTQRHFLQVASGNSDHHPLEVESVMKTEYRVAMRASRRNDFAEGVRAVLVDKDQNFRWDPQKVEDVDFTELASLFDPLEPSVRELDGSQAHPSLLK